MKVDYLDPRISDEKVRSTTKDLISRINFVKDRLSFAEVCHHYGLPWLGDSEHQFSCHFHGKDNHPSAHYYPHPERRIWCFACQEGGDVVWWVKKKEGLKNVSESLDLIAKIFGIGLDRSDLSKRIELEKQTLTSNQSKRELYTKLYSDKVNDLLYEIRKKGSEFDQKMDAIERLIFDRKYEIQETPADYLSYVGLLRNWLEWSKDMVTMSIRGLVSEQIQ